MSSLSSAMSGSTTPRLPKQPELPIEPELPLEPEPKIEVIDLGPDETPEYNTGVGDKCDDRTDNYNVDKQDFDLSMFKK